MSRSRSVFDDPRAPSGAPELRAELGDGSEGWTREREQAWVRGVLALTVGRTPEECGASSVPAGWRGDVHLVVRFLAERLRASRPLRIAVAASALLHLAAVPALAWWLLVERPPAEPRIRFELPQSETGLAEVPEPERELWPGVDERLDVEGAGASAAVENALRRARFTLATRGLPQAGGAPSEWGPAARWLARRAQLVAGALTAAELGSTADWRAAGSLERILWAEALLDAYVLRKRLPSWVPRAWADLEIVAGAGGELAPLAHGCLERAASYGIAGAIDVAAGAAGPSGLAPTGAARSGGLPRAGWTDAVAAALDRRGELSPAVRAWLSAARR